MMPDPVEVPLNRDAVEIVMPVYRPDFDAMPRIIAAARAQRGITSRLTMILDGPCPPVEARLTALISGDPSARLLVRQAARSDISTRGGILEVASAELIVLIDEDVEAPPDLAVAHAEALADGSDVIMGRLENVIPPRRDPLRPAALAYDRWYQRDRELWRTTPESTYWNFWAGNISMTRSTLAAIHKHMPNVSQTYNFDSFYGLIAHELGLTVAYRDDIVARHHVRKPTGTILRIGYRSGRSGALFARAGINATRTDRDAVPLAKLGALPFSRTLRRRYGASHERYGSRMVGTAEWLNARGLDQPTGAILEVGHMLERARGFAEFDRPSELADGIARVLTSAHRAGEQRRRPGEPHDPVGVQTSS